MAFKGVKIRLVNFMINNLLSGTNYKYFRIKRRMLISLGHEIGEKTKIVGPVYITGKLIVGEDTWIGRNFTINGNGTVYIGSKCDIAPDVIFQTGSHIIGESNRRAGPGYNEDINVEDACWIGARSTILPGVTIGKSSVVASCACVCKNVEENCVVGGIPATVIKKL